MLARLDNLPQRHRSVTLHAAAPDVDFRPRCVLAQFSVPRLPRQATGHWHIACGNCGNSKILAAAGPRRASRLAYRLRKLRKPPPLPRQATGHWHIACGNCGNYKILAAAGPRRASRLAYRLRKLRKPPRRVPPRFRVGPPKPRKPRKPPSRYSGSGNCGKCGNCQGCGWHGDADILESASANCANLLSQLRLVEFRASRFR